jgi:hypothetical protein
MDLTLEVMLPPRGALDYSASAHPKWLVLAIVAAYYPAKVLSEITMERTGYIQVTGIPELPGAAGLSAEEIQRRVCHRVTVPWYEADGKTVREKRIWCGDAVIGAIAFPAAFNALRTDRQLTITWAQLKAFLRNRSTGLLMVDADLVS